MGGDLNVILEYCEYGSLLIYLRSKKDDFVPEWDPVEAHEFGYSFLVNIAIEVAKGMSFLESKKV